jgi:PAS domain S-box-containing protein
MGVQDGQPDSQNLDRFFELSLDLLSVSGPDTYFRRVNPAFEQTLGYTQEELLSVSFLELIHVDDRDATLREVEKLQRGVDSIQFANRYRCKDGSFRWLSWSCPAPRNGEDLFYAIARDVTDEREARDELRLRDSILESMHHSLAIADATAPDCPLIYVNPAFEKLTEYRSEEVLGRNCRFLQGDDRNQLPLETLRNAIRDAEPCRVLLRNYTKSGRMFWNELTFSPVLDQNGKLSHIVGFQNDVTDSVGSNLERGEEVFRQIQELPTRQREVLTGLLSGRNIKQVANELGISPKTAEMHRSKLLQKMNVSDSVDLVRVVLTSAAAGHYDLNALAD